MNVTGLIRAPGGSRRVFSTRLHLLALAFALVVPVLTAAGVLAYRFADSEVARFEQSALNAAQVAASAVDRELNGMTVALLVLASSRSLARDEIEQFYHQAVEVAAFQDAVIGLRTPTHALLINTALPWGDRGAARTNLADVDRRAREKNGPVTSDFFMGAVNRRPSIAVVVPVFRDGAIAYYLSASFDVRRVREALLEQPLPAGWRTMLVDRNNVVITSTGAASESGTAAPSLRLAADETERFSRGVEIYSGRSFAAFRRTSHDWTIAVAGPDPLLTSTVSRTIASTIAGALLLISLALVAALLIARRISDPMAALAGMGAVIGRGGTMQPRHFGNSEANSVARSLAEASLRLKARETDLKFAEGRYRRLFNAIDEGFCIIEMIKDADGRSVDYRFIEVNPAFERHTGLIHAVGRTAREMLPDLEQHWVDRYGRVADTGETARFEMGSTVMGRWFNVYASRVDDGDAGLVAVVFSDDTLRKTAENALAASERRYKSALRVGRIGSWETDFTTGSRSWSEEGMALFGLTLDKGKGAVGGPEGGPYDEWWNAIHPDDRHMGLEIRQRIWKEDNVRVEYRVRRPDGEILWVLGHGEVASRGPNGEPLTLINVAADITERKRSEEALKASEARFRAVQDTSIDGFMVLESVRDERGEIVDFRWLYANEAAERIVGRPRDWFIGRWLLEEMPGNRTTGLFDGYVRVVTTGEPWTTEFTYVHDGMDVYLRLVAARASDGFAVTFADLTERRRYELALKDSESRLATALNAGQLGVHVWNIETGELTWDQRLRELWGIDDDRPVTFALFESRLHPEDRPVVDAAIDKALDPRGDGHFQAEYRILVEDGATRWIMAHGDVTFVDGRPVRLVGTARDISSRRKSEEQRTLLIHELNHRVKNTLATVQSIAAQTLRRHDVDPVVRKTFESRLFALGSAHDVLTQESWQGADLATIVQNAVQPFMADPARLKIRGPSTRLTPKEAVTFAMSIHELATNAIKYGSWSTPGGRVSISWTLARSRKARTLTLRWVESGGPPVTPPTSAGFGSRLLQQGLALEFGRGASLSYHRDGLRCSIVATLGANAEKA